MFRLKKARSERELLRQRISRTVRRGILTDWQFILRAKGRIRYVRVPASLQIAGASIVGAFAIWVVHAGYTYVKKCYSAFIANNAPVTTMSEPDETFKRLCALSESEAFRVE